MPMLQKQTSKVGKAKKGTWNGIPCFEYQGSFYFHARTFVGFPYFAKKANHGGMILAKFVDSDSPRVEIKRESAQTQVRGYTIGALRRFIHANRLSQNAAWRPLLSNTGWVEGPGQTEAFEEIRHDAKEVEVNSDSNEKPLLDIIRIRDLAMKVTKLERETKNLKGLIESYKSSSEKKQERNIKLEALNEEDLVKILTLIAKAMG